MKGSNPIIPPGAQFDGARRGRSNMRMAVVVVVLMHMALFAGILFNACKQKDEGETQKETEKEMAGIVNRQPEPAPLPEPMTSDPLPTLPALPNAGSILPPLPTEGSTGVPPYPCPPRRRFLCRWLRLRLFPIRLCRLRLLVALNT